MAIIKIKLVKSVIGRKKSHIDTIKSLGLRKIGQTVEQPDNAATQGKIKIVSYLIETQTIEK